MNHFALYFALMGGKWWTFMDNNGKSPLFKAQKQRFLMSLEVATQYHNLYRQLYENAFNFYGFNQQG